MSIGLHLRLDGEKANPFGSDVWPSRLKTENIGAARIFGGLNSFSLILSYFLCRVI